MAVRKFPDDATPFLPEGNRSLPALREAAKDCRGCGLYLHATQTVFGEGNAEARVVFVGEQPGDSEDRKGRPFVGPAGRIFDEALAAAGLDRGIAYVTNAVKHFKFEERGKRRLHKRPNTPEIKACAPWLSAELATIRPEVLVLLGATAAQALFGSAFSHHGAARATARVEPGSARDRDGAPVFRVACAGRAGPPRRVRRPRRGSRSRRTTAG